MKNTYFPIKIKIVKTGEIRIVSWQEVPNREAFIILETNVKSR